MIDEKQPKYQACVGISLQYCVAKCNE